MYMQERAKSAQKGIKPRCVRCGPLNVDTLVAWRMRPSNLRPFEQVPQLFRTFETCKALGGRGRA